MVFNNYYILKNREITAVILSLMIMSSLFLILDIFIRNNLPKKIVTFKTTRILLSEDRNTPILVEKTKSLQKTKTVEEKKTVQETNIMEETILSSEIEPVRETTFVPELESIQETKIEQETTIVQSKEVIKQEGPEKIEIKSYSDLSMGLNLSQPTYPKSAIKWKKEGIVEIEIHIKIDGSIKDVKIIQSSGHKILDNHCISTIKKEWIFPKQKNEVKTIKRFIFKLT